MEELDLVTKLINVWVLKNHHVIDRINRMGYIAQLKLYTTSNYEYAMARKLNPEDLLILKKIAPELVNNTCGHAGWEFRSVLPPVSQHVSTSYNDFRERILKLSGEELDYLVNLIFEGMESLHCVKKEHIDALIEVVGEKISKVKATELLELYKFAGD